MHEKGQAHTDRDCVISPAGKRIYGSLLERPGRRAYTGIHEPGHPTADRELFRGGVMKPVWEWNVPFARYPGGRLASGFNRENSIGQRENRPLRLDPARKITMTRRPRTRRRTRTA